MSSSMGLLINSNPLNRSWYWLRLFNYYRGALSLFFITVYLNGWAELLISPEYYRPFIFYTASVVYIIAFVIFMPSTMKTTASPRSSVVPLHKTRPLPSRPRRRTGASPALALKEGESEACWAGEVCSSLSISPLSVNANND